MPAASAMSYRPNVAAIITDAQGLMLVCERNDYPGSWQFPQGGVKAGEDRETALWRELEEEVALTPRDVEILQRRDGYRYRFPGGAVKKNKWIGQEQTYFHLKLIAPRSAVTIETAEPEFRDTQWIEPAEFKLRWLPPEKHPVYRQVLQDFFQVDVAIAAEVP